MSTWALSIRSRLLSAGAAALALVGFVGLPASASTSYAEAIQLSWDGGTTSSPTTTETFFGVPVAVPGDSASRTVTVSNAGPSTGVLTATITNVVLDAEDPVWQDITLSWDGGSATFADLATDDVEIEHTSLAAGGSVPIELSYAFDEDSTQGNRSDGDYQRDVTFDVVFTISGEVPSVSPTPTPTVSPTPSPSVSPSPSPTSTRPPLPWTGADVRLPAGVALVLLLGGGAALLVRRRQREQ